MLNNLFFYILLCGICCGPIFTGYILGFSSPTIRDLTKILSVMQISSFASVLYIGGTIGSLLIGCIMDKFGRKRSIILSSIPAIAGWLLIIWCSNQGTNVIKYTHLLYLSRILGGISCGMSMACTTVYLVEISPAAWRGTIASLNQVGITIGIFLSYLIGKYLMYGQSATVALIFTVLLLFTGIIMPESPRWFINKDYNTHAKNSLKRLRPKTANIDQELEEIIAAKSDGEKFQSQPMSISSMITGKYQSKTLVIVQMMLLQQFSGINAFISYADVIFMKFLKDFTMFKHFSMTMGLFQVVFTVIGMAIIDRFGRKSFLKVAAIVMGVSSIVMAISFKMEVGILIVISMITYIIGFSIGWGPIPVISSTEMLPQDARSLASSIAVLVSWIGGYIVTSTFPFVNFMIGEGTVFVVFGLVSIYSVFFVERKVPETRGLSLENIPI